MAGTVTPEEVLATANGNTGRVRCIIDAFLGAVQPNLPAVLEAVGLPEIKGYHWAGEVVDVFPAIVVSGSTTNEEHGTGYSNITHLVCACVFPLPVGRRDWQVATDIADLVRALMYCTAFRGPYRETDEGPYAWHSLHPRGVQPLPPNPERDYGGMSAHFEARQHAAGASFNEYWKAS